MISNLPDDVVHDLLRDLNYCQKGYGHEVYPFSMVKQIIEQWEVDRNKYLKTVGMQDRIKWMYNFVMKNEEGKYPYGSGFIVP